ncbi:transcription elongation factor GreA [Marvinbryantia formatexigens DSM 14469]|uniref:Transcription elongation factor GreA n=2 Tax=Marvinbryantia TaxID=248744 RepID=C6LFM7_9FIRM|nr:transcription elongation factor GreA [Marvinbryantia formatexigens DSM 14469]
MSVKAAVNSNAAADSRIILSGGNIMGETLTRSDVRKIEEEIEYRKLVVRKEAIAAVKEARAQGDLSENFEYYAAKRDKNKNESRIRYLERMLKTARVVSDVSRDGEVGLNNTVEVYFEDDDETETYKIVTSIRGNSMSGKISIESPMGRALLGKKAGDRVYVKVNENAGYYVVIKSVQNTTEDADDKIRGF